MSIHDKLHPAVNSVLTNTDGIVIDVDFINGDNYTAAEKEVIFKDTRNLYSSPAYRGWLGVKNVLFSERAVDITAKVVVFVAFYVAITSSLHWLMG